MVFDTIFLNARFDGETRHHIAVKDGRIAAITPADAPADAVETVDLGNSLVVPGFVEGHIPSRHQFLWRRLVSAQAVH